MPRPLRIAVIGSGISGLSAAWLLSSHHKVALYEASSRLGGHSNTVFVGPPQERIPIDTGFIVYNEDTYPNLVALFEYLKVPTKPSDMSFAVSMDGGSLEYSGSGLGGLFAQARNVASPRFWSMLRDLVRFYRTAAADACDLHLTTLGDYLDANGYGRAFREDHLYPMAAAIWSTPAGKICDYPASAFIRFCENHGLLKLGSRPVWRTVDGGSRVYVDKMTSEIGEDVRVATPVRDIRRGPEGVVVTDQTGAVDTFDHVILAAHPDQSLALLSDADDSERRILGAFRYTRNRAVLHTDPSAMPRRRSVWSSWNYAARREASMEAPSVTYWMNLLQSLPTRTDYFVTLNPTLEPSSDCVLREEAYEHPVFDAAAIAAQREAWSLQGVRNTWYCGAWMGSGFHEDGLQAGLAVAETLAGVRRPWNVENESGRIFLGASQDAARTPEFA